MDKIKLKSLFAEIGVRKCKGVPKKSHQNLTQKDSEQQKYNICTTLNETKRKYNDRNRHYSWTL